MYSMQTVLPKSKSFISFLHMEIIFLVDVSVAALRCKGSMSETSGLHLLFLFIFFFTRFVLEILLCNC